MANSVIGPSSSICRLTTTWYGMSAMQQQRRCTPRRGRRAARRSVGHEDRGDPERCGQQATPEVAASERDTATERIVWNSSGCARKTGKKCWSSGIARDRRALARVDRLVAVVARDLLMCQKRSTIAAANAMTTAMLATLTLTLGSDQVRGIAGSCTSVRWRSLSVVSVMGSFGLVAIRCSRAT